MAWMATSAHAPVVELQARSEAVTLLLDNGVAISFSVDELRWLRGACDRALSAIEYGINVTVPYESPKGTP